MEKSLTPASWLDCFLSVGSLIFLLFISLVIFGADSDGGGNQIALILAAIISVFVGLKNGYRWRDIDDSIVAGISLSLRVVLILLAVGMLVGSWVLSGTVPTMVFYALSFIDPNYFYACSCIICALVALSIGSSWTVASTIGVGLIGAAASLGLSLEITAGAIISGAYFGDKMSPLSDTTNIAPVVAGTDLYSHIRAMTWTTAPSIILALLAFTAIGLNDGSRELTGNDSEIINLLNENFTLGLVTLIPMLIVLIASIKKVPAVAAILLGAFSACVIAFIFQSALLDQLANNEGLPLSLGVVKVIWEVIANGFVSHTGNDGLDRLLSRGGMNSMQNTVLLIISAMIYCAVVQKIGVVQRLAHGALALASSTGHLIFITLLTTLGVNVITGDSLMSIVLPGRLYKLEFQKRGLDPKNLSRALEDAGTMTSALIPWNVGGAFMAATLGVPTFAYLPYCFFNLLCPIVSLIYGYTGFKIERIDNALGPNQKAQVSTVSSGDKVVEAR